MQTNKTALFYDKNFTEKEIEIFLLNIAQTFIQKYFINTTITNQYYEKHVYSILNKFITSKLLKYFTNKPELCAELSLYILKKHFNSIFISISELLLKEVAYSNQNVINFLQYYSLDIIVIEKVKYKVPQVKENGYKWNTASILGTLTLYVKAQDYINSIETKTTQLEEDLLKFNINSLSPIEHNKSLKVKSNAIEENILINSKRINILRDSLNLEKNDKARLKLSEELDEELDKRLLLKESKSKLVKQKVKALRLDAYNDLLKQIEALHHKTKAEYQVLEKNKDAYESMKNSLLYLLTSKKKAIS